MENTRHKLILGRKSSRAYHGRASGRANPMIHMIQKRNGTIGWAPSYWRTSAALQEGRENKIGAQIQSDQTASEAGGHQATAKEKVR